MAEALYISCRRYVISVATEGEILIRAILCRIYTDVFHRTNDLFYVSTVILLTFYRRENVSFRAKVWRARLIFRDHL